MILQYANNIILAQSIGNGNTFILRQSDPTMVLINALLTVEVASIYI